MENFIKRNKNEIYDMFVNLISETPVKFMFLWLKHFCNDFQGLNDGVLNDAVQESSNISDPVCEHNYILNEEVGVLCRFCGFVSTEIKDVLPLFVSQS